MNGVENVSLCKGQTMHHTVQNLTTRVVGTIYIVVFPACGFVCVFFRRH